MFQLTLGTPNHVCMSVHHNLSKMFPKRRLFEHMTPGIRPIAAFSRKYVKPDQEFIELSICQLLKDGIIKTSWSPWRAELIIAKSDNYKKTMHS